MSGLYVTPGDIESRVRQFAYDKMELDETGDRVSVDTDIPLQRNDYCKYWLVPAWVIVLDDELDSSHSNDEDQ